MWRAFFCYFLFFFDVLVAVVVMVSLTIACEQALRGALAAGQEKEERSGELARRLLKPSMTLESFRRKKSHSPNRASR